MSREASRLSAAAAAVWAVGSTSGRSRRTCGKCVCTRVLHKSRKTHSLLVCVWYGATRPYIGAVVVEFSRSSQVHGLLSAHPTAVSQWALDMSLRGLFWHAAEGLMLRLEQQVCAFLASQADQELHEALKTLCMPNECMHE
eukprot:1156911-Pelagomonas_calceolata.AAC.3